MKEIGNTFSPEQQKAEVSIIDAHKHLVSRMSDTLTLDMRDALHTALNRVEAYVLRAQEFYTRKKWDDAYFVTVQHSGGKELAFNSPEAVFSTIDALRVGQAHVPARPISPEKNIHRDVMQAACIKLKSETGAAIGRMPEGFPEDKCAALLEGTHNAFELFYGNWPFSKRKFESKHTGQLAFREFFRGKNIQFGTTQQNSPEVKMTGDVLTILFPMYDIREPFLDKKEYDSSVQFYQFALEQSLSEIQEEFDMRRVISATHNTIRTEYRMPLPEQLALPTGPYSKGEHQQYLAALQSLGDAHEIISAYPAFEKGDYRFGRIHFTIRQLREGQYSGVVQTTRYGDDTQIALQGDVAGKQYHIGRVVLHTLKKKFPERYNPSMHETSS